MQKSIGCSALIHSLSRAIMNQNTKSALLEFIDQIEILAQGVVHMTGIKDCEILIQNAEKLKNALNKDETIL